MFKTRREKRAYIAGIKKGNKGGRPFNSKRARKKKTNRKPRGYSRGGAYNARGPVSDHLVDDRSGPIVFFEDDFDFDDRGRIKGAYTPDGVFEPD